MNLGGGREEQREREEENLKQALKQGAASYNPERMT